MSWIIFYGSMGVVLDILDELTNTRVFSLFHNRMWQSGSEVNVHRVQHWLLVTWLVTCVTADNGLLRSIMFNSFFMRRTCFDLLGPGRYSSTWRDPWVGSNNGLLRSIGSNNGLLRSIMVWVWSWFVWKLLDCWTTCPSGRWTTSEPNSFIQSCFSEIFGGGRGDAYTFS